MMNHHLLVVCLLLLGGCERATPSSSAPSTPTAARTAQAPAAATSKPAGSPETPEKPAQIANPASKNCIDKGGTLKIIDGPGGQSGVCVFPDGSRCEEWRFFRGQCTPGSCRAENGVCN